MKFLQQAIRLRGYAQRDPLTEYKLEGFELFGSMMAQIRRNCIYNVFMFNPKRAQQSKAERGDKARDQGQKVPAGAAA